MQASKTDENKFRSLKTGESNPYIIFIIIMIRIFPMAIVRMTIAFIISVVSIQWTIYNCYCLCIVYIHKAFFRDYIDILFMYIIHGIIIMIRIHGCMDNNRLLSLQLRLALYMYIVAHIINCYYLLIHNNNILTIVALLLRHHLVEAFLSFFRPLFLSENPNDNLCHATPCMTLCACVFDRISCFNHP